MESKDLYIHAVQLAKQGKREEAQQLLVQVLRVDVNHEAAWLWLAYTYPKDEQRLRVLRRCLHVIPESESAKKGIGHIVQKQNPSKVNVDAGKQFDKTSSKNREVRKQSPPERKAGWGGMRWIRLLFGVNLVLLSIVVGFLLIEESPLGIIAEEVTLTQAVGELSDAVTTEQGDLEAASISSTILRDGESVLGFGWAGEGREILIATLTGVHTYDLTTMDAGQSSVVNDPISLAVSSDGVLMAFDLRDKSLYVMDANTGGIRYELESGGGEVEYLVFSPFNRVLAGTIKGTAADQGQFKVHIWNVDSGTLVTTLVNETPVEGCAFGRDGRTFAFSSVNIIRIWDLVEDRLPIKIEKNTLIGPIIYSPTSPLLAGGGEDGTVFLWNTTTKEEVFVFYGHKSEISALAFSEDGKYLASGSVLGEVRLWDANTFESIQVLKVKGPGILQLSFSPGGELLASGTGEGLVEIWQMNEE